MARPSPPLGPHLGAMLAAPRGESTSERGENGDQEE